MTMNKTEAGTISASRCADGVCLGMYGHDSYVSLEYSEELHKVVLLVNDDNIANAGIEVIHVGDGWKVR